MLDPEDWSATILWNVGIYHITQHNFSEHLNLQLYLTLYTHRTVVTFQYYWISQENTHTLAFTSTDNKNSFITVHTIGSCSKGEEQKTKIKWKRGKGKKKVRTVFCARLLTVLVNKIYLYLQLKTLLDGVFFFQILLKHRSSIFLYFQLDMFWMYFLFNNT